MSDLVVAHALPPHTSAFALEILDLTHLWSGSDSDVIEPDDILALAADVHVFIKLHLTAAEVSTHTPRGACSSRSATYPVQPFTPALGAFFLRDVTVACATVTS